MRQRDSRGFTTVFVLMAIVMIAAAVVALATLFAMEVKRTQKASHEGQARMLLLAGADAAGEKVRGGVAAGHFDLDVPADARAARVSFDLRRVGENVEAVVAARSGESNVRQTVVWGREGASGAWVVKSAELR